MSSANEISVGIWITATLLVITTCYLLCRIFASYGRYDSYLKCAEKMKEREQERRKELQSVGMIQETTAALISDSITDLEIEVLVKKEIDILWYDKYGYWLVEIPIRIILIAFVLFAVVVALTCAVALISSITYIMTDATYRYQNGYWEHNLSLNYFGYYNLTKCMEIDLCEQTVNRFGQRFVKPPWPRWQWEMVSPFVNGTGADNWDKMSPWDTPNQPSTDNLVGEVRIYDKGRLVGFYDANAVIPTTPATTIGYDLPIESQNKDQSQ